MKHLTFALILLLGSYIYSPARDIPLTDSLKRQLGKAQTDGQKVSALGQLMRWYSIMDAKQASGYARAELELAETSPDRKLRYRALLDNAEFQLGLAAATSLDSTTYFSQRVISLAEEEGNKEYMAWGKLHLAQVAALKGEHEKAILYINEAKVLTLKVHNDSLQWQISMDYANVYNLKKDRLPAFRNYINALNIAEAAKNDALAFYSSMELILFYHRLGNLNKAKDYAFKALDLSMKNNTPYERVTLYDYMGMIFTDDKLYDIASGFFEKGLNLADSLQLPVEFKTQIYSHTMRQYFLMGDYEKVFLFFNAQKDLHEFYNKNNFGYFADMVRARLFAYTGKPDSALFYFKKAEPLIDSLADAGNKNRFYDWYADYFHKEKNIKNAVVYYTKAEKVCEENNDLDNLLKATANLDSMYVLLGDYKSAYIYNHLYDRYKDSLQRLTNEKELLSAEIDQEALQREKAAEQETLARERRHNIQYLGITAALAAVIILLLMGGIFRVSTTTIKALGFFTFIFLFEFIVVLADEKIHTLTHGEPWEVLGIKIMLASILFPLHHYTEGKVIHYLSSHKLLNLKKRNIFARFKRKPKPVVVKKEDNPAKED